MALPLQAPGWLHAHTLPASVELINPASGSAHNSQISRLARLLGPGFLPSRPQASHTGVKLTK